MSSQHNKRKNSGLLYEFFVRAVSQSLIDDDQKKSAAALKVLRKHFRPGTELYKEFRLINALVRTTVSSDHVAANVISEAKVACRQHDEKKLEEEKQLLLRDIRRIVRDEDFFERQVSEYKAYATAQVLLNEWRLQSKGKADLSTVAKYEDSLMKWLVTEKLEPKLEVSNEETSGTNRVLMRVMMKKLNEKYSGVLTPEQSSMIRSYALASAKDDPTSIKKKLLETKQVVLQKIEESISDKGIGEYVVKKLVEAKDVLTNESVEKVDDSTISRFLVYLKLKSELESEE